MELALVLPSLTRRCSRPALGHRDIDPTCVKSLMKCLHPVSGCQPFKNGPEMESLGNMGTGQSFYRLGKQAQIISILWRIRLHFPNSGLERDLDRADDYPPAPAAEGNGILLEVRIHSTFLNPASAAVVPWLTQLLSNIHGPHSHEIRLLFIIEYHSFADYCLCARNFHSEVTSRHREMKGN